MYSIVSDPRLAFIIKENNRFLPSEFSYKITSNVGSLNYKGSHI